MDESGTKADVESLAETQNEGTAQGKFPFLERLARLADHDRSYRNSSELRNMALLDDVQGQAYLQSPPRSVWDSFILDFDTGNLTAKSFTESNHQSEELFCAALREVPIGVETRMILLQPSHFPAILSPKVVEILGQSYDIDPRLFGRMLKAEPGQLRGRELGIPDREPDLPLNSCFLSLGYRYKPEGFVSYQLPISPQVWAQITSCSQNDGKQYNLVLVYLYPAYKQGDIVINHHKAVVNQEHYSYLSDVCTLAQWTDPQYRRVNPQMAHCLDYLHKLNALQVESANQTPLEYLNPFFEILEAHCHHVTQSLRIAHQQNNEAIHLFQSTEERDQLLFTAWKRARGHIEDFQSIADRINAYQDLLSSRLQRTPCHSETMELIFRKQTRLLAKSRQAEQHIRDTIQLNVGNLSLQESRKSLQQADTIGRVSILAFVFLPLSLVTSFFGMNVRQWSGVGASWQTIAITASTLCTIVFLVCLWMWRKSFRILAFRAYFPVILLAVIGQLPMILYYFAVHLRHLLNQRLYLGLTLKGTLRRGLEARPAGPFIQEWWALSETVDQG